MKKKDAVVGLLLLLAIYGLTLGVFYSAAVTTMIFTPTKDSYAWESVPNANNGRSDNFEITSYDKPPYNMRGWIEFNTSQIPSDVWVLSAKLRLRLWHKTTNTPPQGDATGRIYGVYRVTQRWGENTVTWANQPNYTESHYASASVPTEQGGWYGPIVWMEWDVTDIVGDWQHGMPNYGFVVRDTQENESTFYSTQFFTHDQVPNSGYFPRLVVTYVHPTVIYALLAWTGVGTTLVLLWLRFRKYNVHLRTTSTKAITCTRPSGP